MVCHGDFTEFHDTISVLSPVRAPANKHRTNRWNERTYLTTQYCQVTEKHRHKQTNIRNQPAYLAYHFCTSDHSNTASTRCGLLMGLLRVLLSLCLSVTQSSITYIKTLVRSSVCWCHNSRTDKEGIIELVALSFHNKPWKFLVVEL